MFQAAIGFRPALLVTAAALVALPQSALAQQVYSGTFTALNNSGVSGTATLTLSADAHTLNVLINASGLEAGEPHVAHIHGLESGPGMPLDSTTPTLAQDADHDGYIELGEGLTTYGPIILPLTDFDAAMTSTVAYNHTFNLLDPSVYGAGFNITDLLGPNLDELQLRELVLHGMTVPPGPGAGTPGEVNGTNGYLGVLPVASAEIVRSAVPEPATWAMMLFGFGAIGFQLRRRRTQAAHAA